MIQQAMDRWGRLDILYNNAGIAMEFTPVEELSEEQFDRMLRVNLKGVFLGSRFAVPVMKRQGGGVILNTASTAAIRPRAGLTPYNVSKAGVVSLTKSMALELASAGIRVNCICPAATDTPLLGQLGSQEENREKLRQSIPLGQLIRPEEIAQAALYLTLAPSVTGVALEVDGGRTL